VSRIPSDVDNTIWQIAERGDHQAAQDFNDKFPALAQAMNDRMRMRDVAQLVLDGELEP